MAYNSYYPVTYQSPVQPQPMAQMNPAMSAMPQTQSVQQPQGGNGLIWVQGESGAKSYLLAPSTTVMLMDSEADRFYLKSSDASGMPLPLRVFEYHEVTQNGSKIDSDAHLTQNREYVTRDEFDTLKRAVEALTKNEGDKHESAV